MSKLSKTIVRLIVEAHSETAYSVEKAKKEVAVKLDQVEKEFSSERGATV